MSYHHHKKPQEISVPQGRQKPLQHFAVVIYETLQDAKNDLSNIEKKSHEADQLNIVIRAEGISEDPDITKFGKLFSGKAWALIHENRIQEGWYNVPH